MLHRVVRPTPMPATFDALAMASLSGARARSPSTWTSHRLPRWFSMRRDRGILAMVDFNRRFDRDYAELRRVVAAGDVGKVHLIQMTSRGPSLPPLEYIAVSGGQMRHSDRPLLRPREVDRRRGTRGGVRDGLDVDRAETQRIRRRRPIRGHSAVSERRAGSDRQCARQIGDRIRRAHRGTRIDPHGRSRAAIGPGSCISLLEAPGRQRRPA